MITLNLTYFNLFQLDMVLFLISTWHGLVY